MKEQIILQLNLFGEHFDKVLADIKKEEYRVVKDSWARQLLNLPDSLRKKKSSWKLDEMCVWLKDSYPMSLDTILKTYKVDGFKEFTHIMFSNGFAKDRRQMLVEFNGIDISKGKVEWGAVKDVLYFNIKLGDVVERIRC